nr:MAG TPA: hypothetical protein [Caudoviricetes sp.]
METGLSGERPRRTRDNDNARTEGGVGVGNKNHIHEARH